MLKKELIWREILYQNMEKGMGRFTQKELAQKFSISLSTVFHALKIPRQLKIIEVKGRGFQIRDREKFLYLWATTRNLEKDVIYQTHLEMDSQEIESSMPDYIIHGLYSAYTHRFSDIPADYDKIYVYIEEKNLKKFKERFPEKKGYANLIVLKSDAFLDKYGTITPLAQTFVDLWNVREWYGKEFIKSLKEKIISQ